MAEQIPTWDDSIEAPPTWEESEVEEAAPTWAASEATPESKQASWWEKVRFGFSSTNSDIQNLGLILESKFPIAFDILEAGLDNKFPHLNAGNVEEDERDAYLALTEDERRNFLNQKKNDRLKADFPELYASGESSGWELAGSFAGVLNSPTTLTPFGATWKVGIGVGALLGLEYDLLDQYAKTGEIDPSQSGTATVVGGVGGGVAVGLSKLWHTVRGSMQNKAAIKDADKLMGDAEVAMAKAVAEDVPLPKISEYVQKATGKTREELAQAVLVSGRKPRLPSKDEALALVQIQKDNMLDPAIRSSNSYIDQLLGVLSTRVGMINQNMKLKLRDLDMATHEKTHVGIEKVKPFEKALRRLPKKERLTVNRMLYNGDFDDALAILRRYDKEAGSKFGVVTKLFKDSYKDLKNAGYKSLKDIPNYFPRVIKDWDGMQAYLRRTGQGRKSENVIMKAIKSRAAQLKVKKLPVEEEQRIINNVLRGYAPKINNEGLSFVEDRTLPRLTDEMMQFYADPIESLHTYIRSTANNIEKRKFFGQSAKAVGDDGLDIDDSIDTYLAEQLKDLHPVDADVLRSLLNARFINGEKGANNIIQGIRNMGYLTTLANPIAAATQLSDISIAAFNNGLRNTVKAMVFGDKRVSMQKFGLDDIIAEEFSNEAVLARTLHKFFTLSGFRAVDKYGKNVLLRGAWNKGQDWAKTPKGMAKLKAKYGEAYGPEFQNLVDDLKASKITQNTKLYLWSELADVQPIALSETPQKYLEVPNGRLLYSLKTFALKQLDILRREVWQKRNTNPKEAIRNALIYATLVPTSVVGVEELKKMMLGREALDPEDFPDEWLMNLMSIFGGSEYVNDRYIKQGDVSGAIMNTVSPAVNYLNAIAKAGIGTVEGIMGDSDGFTDAQNEILNQLPIIGRFWQNYFGGGLEAYEEREKNKD